MTGTQLALLARQVELARPIVIDLERDRRLPAAVEIALPPLMRTLVVAVGRHAVLVVATDRRSGAQYEIIGEDDWHAAWSAIGFPAL